MKQFDIVTEETGIDVRFKPHLPGLGARATGLTGAIHATLDEAGEVDLSRPLECAFAVSVDDFDLGNRVINAIAKRWLGSADKLAVTGRIGGFKPTGKDSFEATVVSQLKQSEYSLSAEGILSRDAERGIRIDGTTKLHPRDVGMPVPRFGIPHVHVHWQVVARLVA